jgi:uncharacterized phosphatase
MKICLLRHGETDWNNLKKLQGRENIPLNMTGIKQITETAKYLKNNDWKIIITSPLLRAKTSAEIISKEIENVKIHEDVDFIERDYGKASGMTSDERKIEFPNGKHSGIESYKALQSRTVNALLKYIKKYKGRDIIIISHGAAINSMLAYVSKNKIGTKKTILKNACMTLLEETGDEIRIIYFNKTVKELK